MAETIFGKIVAKEIPADIIYEDGNVVAFRDVDPKAPVHFLVVPKKPIENLLDTYADDTMLLGKLLEAAVLVAREQGLAEGGFRVVINVGADGGQSVSHLHVHVLGGRRLTWPPG
jgi:histidine triad (HIT) family protein